MNVFLLMVALASPAEAPKAGLQEAAAVPAAVAAESLLPEVSVVKAAIPPRIGVWAPARSETDCNLADLYHRRFLSGPWSVTRRLEAARLRGDTDEAKRMEAMLDDLLGKAINAEGE